MKYFYISRNAIRDRNEIVLYDQFNMQIDINAFRTGLGKEDAIEYIGDDNLPNDLIYDAENDVVYSSKDKPSPYHSYVLGEWVITDVEGYRTYCNKHIDELKAEILEYGFDYQTSAGTHRQRCRDKDISYMVSTITAVDIAKRILNVDKKVMWYFEDSVGVELDYTGLATLMLYGTTFIESVFDAENYFKTLETPKYIDKQEYLRKIKEIQLAQMRRND